ncbi:MAG: hypothetical protein VB979_05175 [Acinetobacter sp.]|uniref:Uncharacterized protein n=1 Tax=Acinetobacter albensis TaxID=1673609 RepID=A0ABW9JUE0_9GAMM|nr:hypothetical protein [Acinetobacter albensis]MBE9400050.1 hypothetical protein [Acinetobacter albensis]
MSNLISLKLKPETHQRFQDIHRKLNAGERTDQAKPLGENLADITCEIIDQVFGTISKISTSQDQESDKVIQQILDTTRKYMPWSVSFFGNERLTPMVNYLQNMTYEKDGHYFIAYSVDKNLISELMGNVDQIKAGNGQYVSPALKIFTQVVDQGVTSLIREPKKMLKFNMVVDKTLNGVISLTTQLGYKRFDKLGSMYDAQTISQFFDHFLVFLENQAKTNV